MFAVFDKAQRKGFLLCLMLFSIQSFSGMYAIHSYSLTIFIESGINLSPPAATTIYGCIQISGTISATRFVDKWGRKVIFFFNIYIITKSYYIINFQTLMTVSIFGVSVSLLTLATYFYFKKIGADLSNFEWVPVLTLCLCVYIYCTGAAAIPFVYVSDVLVNEVIIPNKFSVFVNLLTAAKALEN